MKQNVHNASIISMVQPNLSIFFDRVVLLNQVVPSLLSWNERLYRREHLKFHAWETSDKKGGDGDEP